MYLEHFHFTQAPFSITPDPEFVYLSEKHQESLAHLVYGVTRGGGAGFVQLTGEVGTGKTTISRLFLQKLPEGTQAALILNPNITPVELLENVLSELGIDAGGVTGQLNAMIDRLNTHLLEWYEQGKNTVVIIDEAQNIPRDTLEQLRLLTNLETSQQKLLQIVLIGQPELKTTMQRRDLRQLSQRITSRFHLLPLSVEEMAAYIKHRLAVAGVEQTLFSKSRCQQIHRLTQGTPRLVNTLCDRALLTAYVDESPEVKSKHVKQAAVEVLGQVKTRKIWPYVVLGLVLLFSCLAYLLSKVETRGVITVVEDTAQAETPKPTSLKAPGNDVAWQAYVHLWHPDSVFEWLANHCPSQTEVGMSCLRRQGNLNQIKRLNTPVLLEMDAGELLLIQSIEGDQLQVLTQMGKQSVSQSKLEAQWFGTYFVLWPLAEELIGDTMPEDIKAWVHAVAPVITKRKMSMEQSQQWVVEFQQNNGLLADGIVGKETQMAMSLQAYNGPKLNSK